MDRADNFSDRELFSELVEPPINPVNPLFLGIRAPSMKHPESPFELEITGEALWELRHYRQSTRNMFKALCRSLSKIHFELTESCEERVAVCLKSHVHHFYKKMVALGCDSRKRKELRTTTVQTIHLRIDEIAKGPGTIIEDLTLKIERMAEERKNMEVENEKRAAELYDAMAKLKALERTRNAHRGKDFTEVGERQQRRNIGEIRNHAEQALWFAETFGLMPQSLHLTDRNGKEIDIDLGKNSAVSSEQSEPVVVENQPSLSTETNRKEGAKGKECTYEKLDDQEKEKIKSVVYIMDRFSLSGEGYHELTQLEPNLPRSYLVEGCIKSLNKRWNVTKTPGICAGAELPFSMLLRKEIEKLIVQHGAENVTNLRVKISGDGASMSRSSNLFVCSFSLLDNARTALSSEGNHAVAVVKCSEDYNILKTSLKNVISEVNQLVKDKAISIDGHKVNLSFFLGGDYKFLLLAHGMNGATSNHSCIWCKIFKNDRCDLSLPHSHFKTNNLKREKGADWHKQPGCFGQPFFDIPLNNVVIDDLHLLLRVTDRLEKGIVMEALDMDQREKTTKHTQALIAAMKAIGITFGIWKKKESSAYDWTPLMGKEKALMLRRLPDHFSSFLQQSSVEPTKKLWVDFAQLYDQVRRDNSEQDIAEFENKARSWGQHLLNMRGHGYTSANAITPYIHIFIYHVPDMLRKYTSIAIFAGQGVEKKNDDFRRAFHRKINRWDACHSLLLIEKRRENLQDKKRKKRNYIKIDKAHWQEGGKSEVVRKIPRISNEIETELQPIQETLEQIKKMKTDQLVELLLSLGISVQKKKTPKKDMIRMVLEVAKPSAS